MDEASSITFYDDKTVTDYRRMRNSPLRAESHQSNMHEIRRAQDKQRANKIK